MWLKASLPDDDIALKQVDRFAKFPLISHPPPIPRITLLSEYIPPPPPSSLLISLSVWLVLSAKPGPPLSIRRVNPDIWPGFVIQCDGRPSPGFLPSIRGKEKRVFEVLSFHYRQKKSVIKEGKKSIEKCTMGISIHCEQVWQTWSPSLHWRPFFIWRPSYIICKFKNNEIWIIYLTSTGQ